MCIDGIAPKQESHPASWANSSKDNFSLEEHSTQPYGASVKTNLKCRCGFYERKEPKG